MDTQIIIMAQSPASALAGAVSAAMQAALVGQGRLNPDVLRLSGMSGTKYRLFINTLIGSLADPRYLEVGVLGGSTLCSAIDQNRVTALAIDNWSEFDGPSRTFFTNLARFKHRDAHVSFLESDFRAVSYGAIGRFNVYLFDGPHEAADQRDGITLALPALDDQFVFIVDDWNWSRVREGTIAGIAQANLRIDHQIEIRTTLDDSHGALIGEQGEWHNGYFIGVLSKRA
jgi:hypothetical protein